MITSLLNICKQNKESKSIRNMLPINDYNNCSEEIKKYILSLLNKQNQFYLKFASSESDAHDQYKILCLIDKIKNNNISVIDNENLNRRLNMLI